MPWIPEEEIKRAREITAIEYLKKYQPNRLKKSSARNEWELTDHDSFKINEQTSQWHWKSRDIGGTSALNFLIHVDGCSFLEAVQMLKDEYPTYIPPPVEAKPKKPFVLPTASPDCRRVFRYLKERGISGEVLQRCVHLGILYESLPYHNAVFIGRDENQVARYAFLRGIYDASGRSIITVVALMAQGITDSSLKFHLQNAKDHGVTQKEIAAIITHIAFYAGWPKGWAVFNLAKEVWNEEEIEK